MTARNAMEKEISGIGLIRKIKEFDEFVSNLINGKEVDLLRIAKFLDWVDNNSRTLALFQITKDDVSKTAKLVDDMYGFVKNEGDVKAIMNVMADRYNQRALHFILGLNFRYEVPNQISRIDSAESGIDRRGEIVRQIGQYLDQLDKSGGYTREQALALLIIRILSSNNSYLDQSIEEFISDTAAKHIGKIK